MASTPKGGLILHRYSGSKYIRDLNGEGARLNGGRWNQVNTAVVYTSIDENVAFSEYARRFRPRTLLYSTMTGHVRFDVPAGISVEEITEADLPANWRDRPAPVVLQELGTAWAARGSSCLLKVPTALNASADNYLINPAHAEFDPAWATVTDPATVTTDLVDASLMIAP
ncbi:MAG: RES family NAD+ phosphorylase [Flavobacteriales bacterium]|nr:RES family NAD+ phosphorylase [Flavobacteriales bacterium]